MFDILWEYWPKGLECDSVNLSCDAKYDESVKKCQTQAGLCNVKTLLNKNFCFLSTLLQTKLVRQVLDLYQS